MDIPPPQTSSPSKVALVMIGSSPLALVGLDRMYMGCSRSGWAKFTLFVLVFVFGFFLGPLWPFLALIYAAWVILDFIQIVLNALSLSQLRPFCDKSTTNQGWASKNDIHFAFWINLSINLTFVAIGVLLVSISATMGFDAAWDYIRSITRTEDKIPDGEEMIAYYERLTGTARS